MSKPQDFRDLLNLLETVQESQRKSRTSYINAPKDFGAAGVSNTPVPFADKAVGQGDDPDWMRKAATRGRSSERVFFDPENPDPRRRMPFIKSYDLATDTTTYLADNGAQTIGDMNANKLRRMFAAKGKQENKDYIIDQTHGVVKVFGSGKPATK